MLNVISHPVKIRFLIIVCSLGFVNAGAQVINKAPLSPRQTGYRISAELNPDKKKLTGSMQAYWVNMSNDIVPDIQMHLYMNAFKNKNTTLNRELGVQNLIKEAETGYIDIIKFTDGSGNDLLPNLKFISPDDGNISDQSVADIILPKAAMPGDTVYVNIDFETKLPILSRRTGYKDDFYFVAQWFPKFGVYENAGMRYAIKGSWNCHQFHANSEFYSNHSLYNVSLTLPNEFIVGTGGLLMKSDSTVKARIKTLTYRAEDIVDFAWTAWPEYAKFTDKWENVNLTLLTPFERVNQVERQFTSVKHALEYFTKNVGPYPWPYLTIVDPPAKGAPSGGMEYTTIFTSTSTYMMPDFIRMPEMVTIHEFGHAYFMGILASNEFEEPWLDEGVNSFLEERIVDHYYGENSGMIDLPWFKLADKSIGRLSYVHSEGRQLVSNKEYSWNYPRGTYAMMSYEKTATWLYTLMGIVGEETTNDIFREYYRKWAFRHPSGKDFIDVANDVIRKNSGDKFGPDMNWFFDQTVYGTSLCDYKAVSLKNVLLKSSSDTTDTKEKNHKESKPDYKSKVQLERAGDMMLPVDVLIHFDNGEEILENWDGKSRIKDYEFTGTRKIDWVKIDPEFKIRMDINYINNSITDKPDLIPVRKLTNRLLSFMEFFISIFSL
jgi:hypothetical protein